MRLGTNQYMVVSGFEYQCLFGRILVGILARHTNCVSWVSNLSSSYLSTTDLRNRGKTLKSFGLHWIADTADSLSAHDSSILRDAFILRRTVGVYNMLIQECAVQC